MCLDCVILGALINAGKYPKRKGEEDPPSEYQHFNIAHGLGKCDFQLSDVQSTSTDNQAAIYLRETIETYNRIIGVRLIPLKGSHLYTFYTYINDWCV